MKTNNNWIKTDYRIQSILGGAILLLTLAGGVLWLLAKDFAFLALCLALLLLMPLGAWQVISGLIDALKGNRLQQIYLGVVTFYFTIWYFTAVYHSDYFPLMMVMAVIIAVWKYTVVRADYISLNIIAVPNIAENDILDA
jgi:hypothetical protein